MAEMNGSEFCGSPLWDPEMWNYALPDLTHCFQKVVFDLFPFLVLLVLSPYRIVHLYRSKKPARAHSWLSYMRMILAACLCIIALSDFIYACATSGNGAYPIDLLMPWIRIIALALAIVILQYERMKDGHYFGGLYIFWVLHFLFGILVLYLKIMNATQMGFVEDPFSLATHCLHFVVVTAELALANVPERTKRTELEEASPQWDAGFLSRITYWWFTGTIVLGYKRALEVKDLFPLNPEDRSHAVSALFDKEWKKELEVAARKKEEGKSTSSDGQPLFSPKRKSKESAAATVQPSLPKSLLRVFWPILLVSGSFKLVQDICLFIGPAILKLLIGYTRNLNEADWKGYVYAFLMFLVAALQSLVLHQYFLKCFLIGMRVRSVLISAVYKKALHLTSLARKQSTVGEIVNLMSVDAQRFMDLATYVHMLWSAPFQILVALGYLWQLLGPSTLAGVVAMFLMIPVNIVIANKTKALQVIQMKFKDSRIKVMNEVLNGIKVLKLYAWEPSFRDKILEIRDQELQVLRKSSYLNAVSSFTWACAPFLVSLVTFGVYVLSSPENVLDAEKAFVSVALFNIMKFPIMMLPSVVSQIVQVKVAVQRLTKFLCHEELDPEQIGHDKGIDASICVVNGSFAWEDIEKPTLTSIELNIRPGELVAVVGHVGCGKSSLMSAVLGDMIKVNGSVNVKGSLSYVPQQAWIQNATVRDNVLFGSHYDPNLFSQVSEACALTHDLQLLPAGDLTEIGEKGINLSGGQKQRVSLARALYQDTDVYLLDDPLSAVDAHVAKHIFDKVIGPAGLLKGKTRILVTHGISFLPKVDKIVVMVNGMISETGTFQELIDHAGAFAEFLKQYFLAETEPTAEEELSEADRLLRDEVLTKVSGTLHEDVRALQRQASKIRSESETLGISAPGSPLRQQSQVIDESDERKSLPGRSTSEHLSDSGPGDTSLQPSSSTPSLSEQAALLLSKELCRSRDQISMVDMAVDGAEPEQHDEPATSGDKDGEKLEADDGPGKGKAGEKLIVKEKAEIGRVKMSVFALYARSLGLLTTVLIVLLNILNNVAGLGSNIWLSHWSDDVGSRNDTSARDLYLGIYGLLGLLQGIFILLGAVALAYGSLHASRWLHSALLQNVLRSPMIFFESTPTGRIMNRFSNDTAAVDEQIPSTVRMWINTILASLTTMIIISVYTPMFLLAVVPLGVLYYFIQRFYVATSRQLKRLESVSRSPIYSHFGESITGAPTIRAFGKVNAFVAESEKRVDANQICYYPNIISNRWLAVRLEAIGNLIVLFAALFAVISRRDISAGIVGLSITYALNVTGTLNWLVRMTSELETNVVAVERIKEYTDTPVEGEWVVENSRPPKGWPSQGRIKFDNYSVRYREGLDLVLRGVSCTISGSEKVGIVGRTGAGKSSLTMALFRILEAAEGAIYLDDVKISSIGLHDLRSQLTIIPQDPVIFSGSLRSNLDPFNAYTDDDVWRALELSHLKMFVNSLPDGLQHECSEGGENLSVGQRQLLCLARALLRKTKVLILDEATAAVDLETDDLIQATIKEAFADCTVLTIAHRLNTVMDYTRIMVLDQGQIKELAPPQELLQDKASIFYSMAKDANLVS